MIKYVVAAFVALAAILAVWGSAIVYIINDINGYSIYTEAAISELLEEE